MLDKTQPSLTPLPPAASPYWVERDDLTNQQRVANAMMASQGSYRPPAWQTRRGGLQGNTGMGQGAGGLGGGLMALASGYAQRKQLNDLNKKYGAAQPIPQVVSGVATPSAPPVEISPINLADYLGAE